MTKYLKGDRVIKTTVDHYACGAGEDLGEIEARKGALGVVAHDGPDSDGDVEVTWDHGTGSFIHTRHISRVEDFFIGPTGGASDDELLASLAEAEVIAERASGSCQVCTTLPKLSDQVRPAVESALQGKIGERTLSKILQGAGYDVGVRAINYHRSGHSKRRA